jgi:hypothetical protein
MHLILLTANEQYLLFWDSVPPVIATTFFEPRYHGNPIILQYAHRVLAQHPVEVTFFFVPQIVQALRCDELGGSPHSWRLDTSKLIPSQDMSAILYSIRPGYLSYSATKSFGI